MKKTVYIATSLDGFIARENGDLDWLPSEGDEDYGYATLMASVDTLVMGRNTFETVRSFGAWPYAEKRVVVLSHRPLALPDELAETVETMGGTPAEIVARLAERDAEHLYIDGGEVIQQFLRAGLIDELILTRVPVLLGAGIALFGPTDSDIVLQHVTTRSFRNGLVQSHYVTVSEAVSEAAPDV